MFRLPQFSVLLCITLFLNTAYAAEEMSLERLILLHDIMPNTALKVDATLTPTSQKNDAPTPFVLANTTQPYRVLIDVRSNHSDGAHDFNQLINFAKKRHLDALAFTEHDRYSIRLGLDPVPHILGYSQEHPSLYVTGVENFFADLNNIQQHSSITLFSGTESTPGYYWQGIPFKNLSLHEAERHLITLGAKEPSQVEQLSSYTLKYGQGNKEISLVFWFVFIFMLMFILLRKRKRSVALLLAGSFIAFMSTWMMKPKVNPDQAFIQSAHEQGLFTIWTHPGTKSGVREGPMGVQLITRPYNAVVFESPTADAFAAVYGDTDQNTIPGGLWDQYMMGYMAGYIGKPIWAVAAGDYHEEGQSGEFLGNFPMDVWAKSAKEDDILAALQKGHMAAWQMGKTHDLSLSAMVLEYTNPTTGQTDRLQMGTTAVVSADITLVAAIKDMDISKPIVNLRGQWIVDGEIAARIALSTDTTQPIQPTKLHLSKGRHVIRFQIPAQQGIRLEVNPFLVQVRLDGQD